ncbi:hypothetical protein BAUCODRAFT_123929 [Baudoinia panamericana UAMH 10762]|uniref:Uncharacterized protein n=1 Tax=Baudoinia panamericana (strain UAMH 10762) TaxID=717646 RepID=M2N8V2_BAUPA|nr:uncharacterized protein BAUCODRAFT_123929 [Baudoinia panamericana UAMH 10762]EMC95499.1 hypothetical protein BAUCODRAFT_123929 [Baudoinia panamericana UAMH 10762]
MARISLAQGEQRACTCDNPDAFRSLSEASASADYWKRCSDDALAHGCKGIVMMGAHWDVKGPARIEVATKPNPGMNPVAYNYQLNPDIATAKRVVTLPRGHNIDAQENPTFDWIHDSFLILIRMFPDGCPPTTLLSLNAHYDPHFHMRIGSILRPLRKEGYLLIGTGGAVHNLYRNDWTQMIRYRDNFAMPRSPDSWAMEFRQSFEDAITKNSRPHLRRAITKLMKHPGFRDAHGTDEHFMPATFVAGAAGDAEDDGVYGKLMAEGWELRNMCHSQFTIGSWNRV